MKFRLSECVFFIKTEKNVIAYNNLNFVVLDLDYEIYRKLISYTEGVKFEEDLFKYLVDNRFLIDHDYEEKEHRKRIKYNIRKKYIAKNNSYINYMRISLTENCNLRCKYCFVNELVENKANMSKRSFINGINYLIDNSKNPVVQYFGGEPLIRMDLIILGHKMLTDAMEQEIIESFSEEIVTNGILLNDFNIDFFVKNNMGLIFSIDGWREINDKNRVDIWGKGTYDKVIKNIVKFIDKGGDAEIIITPNNENLYCLDEVVKYLVNTYQIKKISINAPQPTNKGWQLDGLKLAEKIIKIYEFGEEKNLSLSIPGMNIVSNIVNKRYEVFTCSNHDSGINRGWGIYLLGTGELSYCLVEKVESSSEDFENFIINDRIDQWHMQDNDNDICSNCIAYSVCGGLCSMERLLVTNEKYIENKCNFVRTILRWCLTR